MLVVWWLVMVVVVLVVVEMAMVLVVLLMLITMNCHNLYRRPPSPRPICYTFVVSILAVDDFRSNALLVPV